MRAYLKGKGADIWAIVNATSYPATSAVQSHHDANNKAVDILLLSLSRTEFDHVCDLDVAHKIWSRLQSFHEGTNAVKARLFETYRCEYENFVQLSSKTVESLFSRFQLCVNKMRDNNSKMPYGDHELALKLLHALDRSVWGVKVDAITESPNYETLTLEDLYSKLWSTEIDIKSRAKLESPPASSHTTALVLGSRASSANPALGAFSLSALVSVSEEQIDELDDEELALITKKFVRVSDNRRFRKRGNHCYECGKPGHFTADCPNKNKSKGEFNYGKHKNDYGRHKNKDKHKKKRGDRDYHKKRNKARALASLSNVDSESSTSSESSSSDEEDVGKRKKDGKNFNGLCFYNKSRPNYCVMAINADGETSDPEPDSEVNELPPTPEQLVVELEDLKDCLFSQDKLIRKAAKERKELKAELETALNDLESLRSTSASSASTDDVLECP